MNITRTGQSSASHLQKRRVLNMLGNQLLTADERRDYAQQIRHATSLGADQLYLKISGQLQERTQQ